MTEPIRKSSLPCTPPPEWEFSSVLGAPHGVALIPDSDTGPVVVRRRVSYGDWEPVRPDRWAAEEPTDGATAPATSAPECLNDACTMGCTTECRAVINTAWRALHPNTPAPTEYPRSDGDVTVLGPEIFASSDGNVISWKGENYTRQPDPVPELREQVAEAVHATSVCEVGQPASCGGGCTDAAAAVLAVPAIQQLRAEVRRLGLMVDEYSAGARALSDKLARVREWLPVIRRALSSLPEACRYHGDQLDPDRFARMTRSEACCDTGIPARRRREAEQALAALDPTQEKP